MFGINDVVMYGSNGVCRVNSVEKRNLTGKMTEYYVLLPIYNDNSKYYVPADNEEALKKIRAVCSKEEIDSLIRETGSEKVSWLENETLRRDEYNRILKQGDRREIIKLINTLHCRRKKLAEDNKKLRSADEGILTVAENMINEEFAYVLGISIDEVGDYIKKHRI